MGLAVTLGLIALAFLPLMDGGYSGNGYQVALVLLPLAAALAWAAAADRPRWALFTIALYALSVIAVPWMIQGGRELWFYLLGVPAAWAVVWVLHRQVPERTRWFWPVIVGSAVLTAQFGGYLWMGSGRLHYQVTSTFGLHNAYAGYLLLAWPAAAVAALLATKSLWRWCYSAAAILLAVTLVLTYSRAAWLTFVLQLAAVAIWLVWQWLVKGRQPERWLYWLGGGMLASLILLLAMPPVREVLGRVVDMQDYSMQGRLRFWQAALEIFRDHPLGIGLGNFAFVYPQYQQDYVYYSVDPHSWPLQLLSELGIGGIVLLLAILLAVVWWTRRLWKATGGSAVALLLIAAVWGSLAHAAVDFDYTFPAITALLGALLAVGAHLSSRLSATSESSTIAIPWQRSLTVFTTVFLLFGVLGGVAMTLERHQLDHLRDVDSAQLEVRHMLLSQAVRFNRQNHRTHYQLASIEAQPGPLHDAEAARKHLDRCMAINPRYANGWALKALMADDPGLADEYMEYALLLDKYNFPEHYFYYANLAQDDSAKRERLLLGLERIPILEPITPEHVRPTWFELNPLWAEWYYELARLSDDLQEKEDYRQRGAAFQAYWESKH
jgi:O-antigen ligase